MVEIGAEKLRCVMQRLLCRDLFDIHRLLVDEGVSVEDAWHQFVVKATHRNLDPDSFPNLWHRRAGEYKQRWSIEMPRYTGDVPHFDKIMRETERALRSVL